MNAPRDTITLTVPLRVVNESIASLSRMSEAFHAQAVQARNTEEARLYRRIADTYAASAKALWWAKHEALRT